MPLSHIVFLAVIQGLTEFLPISSSAHLVLPSALLGWPDQGLAFDVAVHVGTLLAVLFYFRRDFTLLAIGWLRQVRGGRSSYHARLAWMLAVGTLPAVVAGLLLNDLVEQHLRSMLVIGVATLGFGLLLGYADRVRTERRTTRALTWRDVLIIGGAQALALVPGTSRSGITMTAGLMLGLRRRAAARFSFYLSVPLIIAAGSYKTLGLVKLGGQAPWLDIGFGVVLSALSAYLCIHLFLNLISRVGMLPFVLYRLALGAVLIGVYFQL
jgi:undecaprenyl-diphosphatase